MKPRSNREPHAAVGDNGAMQPVPLRALVVDDEPALAEVVVGYLARDGFEVEVAVDGEDALSRARTLDPDVVVLDLGLPGIDGIEVLKRWRSAGLTFPVLILTARDVWPDKVVGFRAGADDFVLKSFRMDEVLLRLSTLIRRAAGHATAELSAGGLVLDTTTGLVTLDGIPLRLTPYEARLLRFLMLHKGRVASRTELSEHMYDRNSDHDFRSMEVVIGRLWGKIGEPRIETRRGEGYRLLPDNPA